MRWQHRTNVYQLCPRSFYDSNVDGIGDIPGITEKLDYLADLGIETIWLTPFFSSPFRDFGYDISDYRSVAPEYGTIKDFDILISKADKLGLRIVIDLVLNHTSDQHPWFKKSVENDPIFKDFYIWHPGKRGKRPNNWLSMVGQSGWHWSRERQEFYFAQFLPFQPDLNWRNPAVKNRMWEIVRFWLQRGVKGFRLDIINAISKDQHFRDNPRDISHIFPSDKNPNLPFTSSLYTRDLPESLEIIKELRQLVSEYGEIMLVGEVSSSPEKGKLYLGNGRDMLDLVFQFEPVSAPMRAGRMANIFGNINNLLPEPFMPTTVFGNHDRFRRISRYHGDLDMAKLNAFLQFTSRGVPFIYYGEEIGMEQAHLRKGSDPLLKKAKLLPRILVDYIRRRHHESLNRDECRTPFQWDSSSNAGFTDAKTSWLPITKSSIKRNVHTQTLEQDSLLNLYRKLLKHRKQNPSLRDGSFKILRRNSLIETNFHVMIIERKTPEQTALNLMNFSREPQKVLNLPENPVSFLSTKPSRCSISEQIILEPLEGLSIIYEI